ncbi:undecaprenyl-phosphate glucose phosphotransferase [Trinickia fusca]|uniref:Undecaprenyl-phosphate glucose phosphotransferase n=1 Tax=Trinickia fusca TaxID=2419777 RepID=A0A494XCH7_9BURK|nr:undecaprenyl-phosphate glucose phosphotransferase [Trinickia fusca]RKP48310.1 undecaprenyl-phosphate glucose phosphotransferase [Trinickia fusca]
MMGLFSRTIDVALASFGALIAAALYVGRPVWLNDTQSIAVAFDGMLVIALFPAFGIYGSWRGKPVGDLLWRTALAWLVVEGAGVLMSFSVHRVDALSRGWLALWAAMTVALLLATKGLVYTALKHLRRGGFNQKEVAIVGTTAYAAFLIERMKARPDAGFAPVCVFEEGDDHEQDRVHALRRDIAGVRLERDFATLVSLVQRRAIRELWLALPISCEPTIHRIVTQFRNDFVNIRFIPDVRSLSLFNQEVVDLLGVPAITLAASPITDVRVLPKVVFDRLFALAALVALAPLMAMISVAVKLSSPGPVFFRQTRLGIDGNAFKIYKFRTMKVHAETTGKVTQATRHDTRVTRVGRFLRRTSLDELPQFINVLKGEMSVVGPRPHALEHDDLYKDLVKGYMSRYRIKPGITGWAQIHGFRGETDRIEKMSGRVKLDLYYIQNWTFWFDIKIVVLTMWKGFSGSNAY